MPQNPYEAGRTEPRTEPRSTPSVGHDRWTTRLGVILAVAGSAVGLGNFLRFPGQAAENGGGAFMIPYFCALILLGIPIGWAEWAMGRYGGGRGFHSAPAILGSLAGRGGRYLGVIGVMIPLCVAFYYILIEAWCVAYFWHFLTGGIGIDLAQPIADQVAVSKAFFDDITGSKVEGIMFEGRLHESVVFWGIVFALNLVFVYRGLSGGIELFCRWAMPLMAICGIIVLVRVLTLGTPDDRFPDQNVNEGLGFMWNPDFEKLYDFKAWLAAAGQIFFSLSVGFGVIINYASYLRRREDVVLSGLTASATNEFFEVCLGGLITIPAAVAFLGLALTQTATGSSFSLGFHTLPVVFAHMPLGNFFGAVWFFMLFLAAITSSLSMLQPAKAFLQEALNVGRNTATTIVSLVVFGGSLFVIWFSEGLIALDTLDFWVGTFLIFVFATVQIIVFGWVFGIDRGIAEAEQGAQMRIPRVFRFIMKYVTPAYLLIVFGGFAYQNLNPYDEKSYIQKIADNTVVQYSLWLLAAVLVGLLVATRFGEKRWLKVPAPAGKSAEVDYPVTHPGP
jgi:NSS family neurotransmitter:Na+ symporter